VTCEAARYQEVEIAFGDGWEQRPRGLCKPCRWCRLVIGKKSSERSPWISSPPPRAVIGRGGVLPPWDETLSLCYREAFEKRFRTLSFASHETPYMWWGTLRYAATRFPTTHLEPLDIVLPDEPRAGQSPTLLADWRRELKKFDETLELRRRLVKEIPL
jgi:hypothetical protein